ncbi:putative MFS family arabinose efflux permease [Murinocardiopsis flavida]|uniref:Putative MFS family arabinose efflux permease n=1 Tax=Murinocardiopsis flavida TaxID=645275 RepID=A0A2P8CVH2_9ACTN|nr:MFS transporter [Murinocardiopsis flavida]PSK88957.1 putative MFS family arabinose efflux permease [Murinocardiopsis flavida]
MTRIAGRPVPPVVAVLRSRHAARLLTASIVGRLPTGMAPLAIILSVRAGDGDYRLAGLLTGVYAASAAGFGPVLARLIDRTRQVPVLLACGALSTAGFLLLAAIDPVRFPLVAAVAAALAGATTPQLEPCLRVLWPVVLDDERTVRAGFSLDAATQELIFVFGPLIVLGCAAVGGPQVGLAAAGAVGLAGTLWFAAARPARAWRGSPVRRHWLGPLRARGMVRLFAALACVGTTIGAFTVGITGYAEASGASGAAGWLIAANAGGALVAGVAYTGVRAARREDRRLLLLMALLAAGYLPLALVPGLGPMAALAFLSGCALPAVLASSFALVARIAPEGTLTEAHAWMITSFGVGNAVGSALAGTVLDLSVPAVVFAIAAGAGCAAVVLVAAPFRRDG